MLIGDISMKTKNICPTCGRPIGERQITLYSGMVSLLWRIFDYLFQNGRNQISRKEIKQFIQNENDTARLGDWKYFGGLVEKKEKGMYFLNMRKCREFFIGQLGIPTIVWKVSGQEDFSEEGFKTINEIKSLSEFLDEYGKYISTYRIPKVKPF